MKLGSLLEGVGYLEQIRLAEHGSHELQADGQAPRTEKPQGTEMPGMPPRLAEMVKISDRYMVRGSSTFSPRRKAGVGATGVAITWQCSNAASKSRRIKARTWEAFL